MLYRRPLAYLPPYNYCDRWCGHCAIDKTKCLLYQMEMDDHLHREIDGAPEPTADEVVRKRARDLRTAQERVEEQMREMGVDPDEVRRRAAEDPPRPREREPIVEEAAALARGVAGFVRAHGSRFSREAEVLRWFMAMPVSKLHRATGPEEDEFEAADHILQAQAAHRALGRLSGALDSVRRQSPGLTDEMLDLLALLKRLAGEIEERWLARPSGLLAPATDEEWWGPLRDITPTLRQFRR
jgi:hypothetical protein